MAKPRVLCFASYYLPGFRAGGPVRSLMRLCEWLQDDFEFRVVTRNRDLAVAEPYPDHQPGQWYPFGATQVRYLDRPYGAPGPLRQIVADWPPDLLYFHSFVDPALVIMPLVLRRLNLIPATIPALVAPRGEFSTGALQIKPARKAAWIALAGVAGIYRDVTWQATDAGEAANIRRRWGASARVGIGPNLPPRVEAADLPPRSAKVAGTVRLVFLSRISRMKNLHGALASLALVRGPVSLDIYGTQEDPDYWAVCEQAIAGLPPHVQVRFRGVVQPENVLEVLSGYDVFFLPSLGENFGHVVLEALLAGCPLILSDQTPWRGLAAHGVGFDVPLATTAGLTAAVERFVAMDAGEFQTWSANARQFGLRYCHNPELADAARRLLTQALERPKP